MSYSVHIDDFSRNQWEQCAARFADHSMYQTWPYQQIRGEMDGQQISRALVTGKDGRIAAMCQVRIKKIRLLNMTIGYVQWGPLVCAKDRTLTCTAEALRALRDAYIQDKVDVLRIVPNLRGDDAVGKQFSKVLEEAGFQLLLKSERYRTLTVRVDDSEEGIRKRLRKSYRRDLKKAEQAGAQIRYGWDEEFCNILEHLYTVSVKRKGFRGLDVQQLLKAQRNLSENEKISIIVADWNGRPASVHATSYLGDTAVVLLAASNEAGLSCGSSYLVWYQAVVTAFRQGMKWCDLGGIDPDRNPNVYQFKSRLGGEEVFHLGTFEAYSGLRARMMWRQVDGLYNRLKKWAGR
jgi:lipid II:glycine glycyltransferase (peptidoglycan interpeptide bridge formation enzyme)